MARRKGGWRSLLGLAKDRDREPAAKGEAARPGPVSVPAAARDPVLAPTPADEGLSAAPAAPSEPPSGQVEFAEVPAPAPADHVSFPGSYEAGTSADEEEVVSRAAMEAELNELRAEIGWLRGALEQQIVAKKRAEDEVRALSDHDPLTGVASPRRFGDRLAVALIHAQRYKQKLAIFQLGLDNFGVIEEKHGRQIGDDLLKSVAVALESTLRQTDTIARMERDEFTILLPGIKREDDLGVVADKLSLYYQPVVDCETGSIVGVEALLRWRNPERLMSAAEFIPLADVTGLAVPLGQWTLRHACLQGKAWHDAGHQGLVVAVNISARQLQHPSLVKLVRRVLDETGLIPGCLELEVPETELVRNPELAIERLNALKELGVRLALDDFGTGESVLTHLYRYPMDSLKIDGSIVHDLATDRNHEAVATAAIALAKARRIKVVAEGVETETQRILLARWQCDRMQGNLCGPPATAADTEKLLLRQKKTTKALAEDPSS